MMIPRLRHVAVHLAASAWFVFSGAVYADLPIQTWQTRTGARVLFVESHELPMLDIAIEFPAGASRNQRTQAGLAALTLRMLQLGTMSMDEEVISEKLADTGALLSLRFDVDRAGYELRTLSAKRESSEALAILQAMLQSPSFPEGVLEREKARTIAMLRESETRPSTIVEREFMQLAYESHPYGLPASGYQESVAAIRRDDVRRFYREHFTARNAVVAIIGDLSPAHAKRIAEELTSGLPRPNIALRPPPPVPTLSQRVERVVGHPATQAYLRVGMPGMRRGDADYFALWLGNHVLGGSGFASRLTDELREKRGLSYSAYSYFSPFAQPGPFVVEVQTRKDQAPEALEVLRHTLEQFVAEGPNANELEAAKQNVVSGFVLRLDSNSKILEYLSLIGFYRLPLDYVDRFPERIAAVTLAEVRDAFRRRIDPSRMVTVIVGPEPDH